MVDARYLSQYPAGRASCAETWGRKRKKVGASLLEERQRQREEQHKPILRSKIMAGAGTGAVERFADWPVQSPRRLCSSALLKTSSQPRNHHVPSIHCPPTPSPRPVARRSLHNVLPFECLPGRPACHPPTSRASGPASRTRCPSFRILPVRGRRGQGRQVCQQGLCRSDYHACIGLQGRNKIPAASWADRGSRKFRIQGTPLSMRTAIMELH